MTDHLISASQQKLSARIFNIACIVAVLVPPLLMLWFAASIFVYASLIHHPNPRIADYLKPAGYRFYGLVGSLVAVLNFTEQLSHLLGSHLAMWLAVWGLAILVIVPWGVRDILRAGRETWRDMLLPHVQWAD